MESDQISDASVWRSSATDCVWAVYGDDYVVFHRPSGKTHFLNAAGHRLLTEILDRPDHTPSIAARLASAGGGEPGTLDEEDVHAMLVRFEYLGLVDRSVPRS
jgi:PqqD family protein of HPr-rel-A system